MSKTKSNPENLKQVNLIVQSKGGVGKSLLTWLIAQQEVEKDSIFIDLDKSTRTSQRLEKYVGENRVLKLDILDQNMKMERDKLMNMFEQISHTTKSRWFIDVGAPESNELKNLFEYDYPADIVAEELRGLGIDLRIFVVISGNDSIGACINYYKGLKSLTDGHITTIALMNEGTFGGTSQIEQGHNYLESLGIVYMPFGNLGHSESGKEIIQVIKENGDITKIKIAARMMYKKVEIEIAKIINS